MSWLTSFLRWKPKPKPPVTNYFYTTVRDDETDQPITTVTHAGLWIGLKTVGVGGYEDPINLPGRIKIPTTSKGEMDLILEADGYHARTKTVHVPQLDGEGDTKLEQDNPDLPRLMANGQFFSLSNGEPFTAIECSDFNLLAKFVDEGPLAIKDILNERAGLGFNMLRVWTLFNIPGIGHLMTEEHPELYLKIPAFCKMCASYGFWIEFTAYTGINDPEHWTNLGDAVRLESNVILELVNELDQNTNEPDHLGRVFNLDLFSKLDGIMCAHGSNGSEAQPILPHWDYATFHTNDAFEEQRKIGHNAMEIWNGPTLTNETGRFPDRRNSEDYAYDSAAGASLLCAGSCFHSISGKTSKLFDDTEFACATMWVMGAGSVPLDCQDGGYEHLGNLEGPDDLRVYRRGGKDECLVRISK